MKVVRVSASDQKGEAVVGLERLQVRPAWLVRAGEGWTPLVWKAMVWERSLAALYTKNGPLSLHSQDRH